MGVQDTPTLKPCNGEKMKPTARSAYATGHQTTSEMGIAKWKTD